MKTHLIALLCGAVLALAQTPAPLQTLMYYDGSSRLEYICSALATQVSPSTITVSTVSNASPASVSAASHGFDYQSGATIFPLVTVTGGTGNWAAFNGTWAVTPTSANAFTVAVDTSGFGAITGTLVFTTLSPRTTLGQWTITRYRYSAAGAISIETARVAPGVGVSTPTGPSNTNSQICANRASTTMGYQ